MPQNELNEGTNKLEVVGTLKSKDLEYAQNKNGVTVIRGNVIVEWKDKDRLQNTRVNVYSTQYGRRNPDKELGSYTSVYKLMNDFKDMDTVGAEDADRIRVSGNVGWNPYVDNQGQLRQSNRLSGQFFSRIDKDDQKYVDHASALLSLTVAGYTDIMVDNVPTGNKAVSAFNVGYGERIVPILDLQFSMSDFDDSVVDQFASVIAPGETALMEVSFNNYEVVKETVEEMHGFGGKSQMSVASDYVRNAEIVFSNGVVFDPEGPKGLTQEQIIHAKELKDATIAEAEAKSAAGAGIPTQPGVQSFGKQTTPVPQAKPQAKQESGIPTF